MKERRIKSLQELKNKKVIVDKMVVYDDNNNMLYCNVIEKDSEGHEYYSMNNMNDPFGSYSEKVGDAVNEVLNGDGDCIKAQNLLGLHLIDVVRFLDRDFGKEMKKKSIEGFKDSEFVYRIKFESGNSFKSYILNNDMLLVYFEENLMSFKTEEEARNFIKEINDKVKEYAEVFRSLTDSKEKEIFVKKLQNKNLANIYYNLFESIIYNDDYNLKVVQDFKREDDK